MLAPGNFGEIWYKNCVSSEGEKTARNCGNTVTIAVPDRYIPAAVPGSNTRGPRIPMRVWLSAILPVVLLACTRAEKLDLERLKLPPGFHIAVFASAPHVRQMAFSPGGVVLATDMSDGTVFAYPDPKNTGHAEKLVPVLAGLNAPPRHCLS